MSSRGRPHRLQPLIEFPRDCGYLPEACRAKTKGKVKRPYRYMREDFFFGRTTLDTLVRGLDREAA